MILPINKNVQISTDPYNWIIEQRKVAKSGSNAGQERWESISYHPSLKSAVQSLHERNIRMDDAVGVQAVLEVIERSTKEITAALEVRKEQLTLI